MPSRRSHKKSRAGCRRCKARKIKCDEVHPRCGGCTKHDAVCDFQYPDVDDIQMAVTPATPMVNSPGSDETMSLFSPVQQSLPPPLQQHYRRTSETLSLPRSPSTPFVRPIPPPDESGREAVGRLMELRLLHHFTTHTYKTLTVTGSDPLEDIWRLDVPRLAFARSSYLIDSVLAVAALHLRSLYPNDAELRHASHAYMVSSVHEYSKVITAGVNEDNAARLFLASTLITFQCTASRVFSKDESIFVGTALSRRGDSSVGPGGYQPPLSWFHSTQGVKTVVGAAWQWLRSDEQVSAIINSQPPVQLDFDNVTTGFFGHLLDDLEDELAEIAARQEPLAGNEVESNIYIYLNSTKQAYQHAVATLNWAHRIPTRGSLMFPATVSKRFVELVGDRSPRALAILACFFALLKPLNSVWWLRDMARREVMGIVSLFNSDSVSNEIEAKWWPHLGWAVKIALYDGGMDGAYVPSDVWGADWSEDELLSGGAEKFTSHIDRVKELMKREEDAPSPEPVD